MTVSRRTTYRGRKQKIGSICSEEGKLKFFLGYHDCQEGGMCKLLVSVDEAREFSARFGYRKRDSMFKRMAIFLLKRMAVQY